MTFGAVIMVTALGCIEWSLWHDPAMRAHSLYKDEQLLMGAGYVELVIST